MGFGGFGGGSGARPGRRFTRPQLIAVIVVVSAALVAIELARGKIDRFEIIYFLVLIPSIIIHEISHGVVALWCGDDTAKRAGRLSLNPVRHVDPIGTLLVPAILSFSGLGAYGWAKPVPVSTNRLRNPRNQTVVVSLIGPVTNFTLAAIFGIAFALTTPVAVREFVHLNGLGQYPDGSYDIPSLLGQVLFIAGFANIVLGVFNLIPCPPLDGASVLERFIPAHYLPEYYRLQPVLMFLPFLLIFFFRSEWAALINHVITWWSGLLV
jgi:Zn-dependent protease